MPETRSGVIGGVDTHSRTHHAVALDNRGERLGDAEFPATARGYRELHQWLEAFATIAEEGTSSYGAGLTRWLLAQGLDVREVNQPRRRQGKPESTDRSLRGRDAGLAESSAGVAASAGWCRSEERSLGGAEGAGARVREARAGMLARGSERVTGPPSRVHRL